MGKALVQLGRYGDIMNVLPLLEENNRVGRRVPIAVASQFADLLEGVSYTDAIVCSHDCTNVEDALVQMRIGLHEPVVSQVYGRGLDHRRSTESYMRDSWNKVGKSDRWEQLSLFFDRRSAEREEKLAAQVDWSKPVVLYNLSGHSSPFARAHAERIERAKEMTQRFSWVDLGKIRAEKVFDLLGLMDRAHALVTVDTMTLHLAKASPVPVVALVNPDPWYASLRTANHLLHRPYNQINPSEIVDALKRTLRKPTKLVHVWTDYNMGADDRARHEAARASWLEEYKTGPWVECRIDETTLDRNTSALGDSKPVAFVKDVIARGRRQLKKVTDVLVITNTDVGFTSGMTEPLSRAAMSFGAAFSYRFNFDVAPAGGRVATTRGYWDGGLDMFAFTKKWLDEHFDQLPDMVLGRTHWDLVYRDIIKHHGGADVTGSIWHVRHQSFWTQNRENVGNAHNIAIAREFYAGFDTTRPYRFEAR